MLKLEHVLAFGTPNFYIAPYDKIIRTLVNLSYNCNVKSGLNLAIQNTNLIQNYINFPFLARLDEVQKSLCTTPGVGVSVHIYVKVFQWLIFSKSHDGFGSYLV